MCFLVDVTSVNLLRKTPFSEVARTDLSSDVGGRCVECNYGTV